MLTEIIPVLGWPRTHNDWNVTWAAVSAISTTLALGGLLLAVWDQREKKLRAIRSEMDSANQRIYTAQRVMTSLAFVGRESGKELFRGVIHNLSDSPISNIIVCTARKPINSTKIEFSRPDLRFPMDQTPAVERITMGPGKGDFRFAVYEGLDRYLASGGRTTFELAAEDLSDWMNTIVLFRDAESNLWAKRFCDSQVFQLNDDSLTSEQTPPFFPSMTITFLEDHGFKIVPREKPYEEAIDETVDQTTNM